MTSEEQVSQAMEVIRAQLDAAAKIVDRVQTDRDTDAAYERLKRWKARTVRLLREEVSAREADRLDGKRKGSFIMGAPFRNLVDEIELYTSFLRALEEELESHPEDVLDAPRKEEVVAREVDGPPPGSSSVFIVHGHDELNLLRLKEVLRERWDLDTVVMSSKPGRGRTLIEKFEQEAQQAVFALVLMSPDDTIASEDSEYAQARPNVVFELGWFYGRLGRERVCILFKDGTKIHSDLDGVSRIQFTDSVSEVVSELENELVEAGVLTR